jgi:vacuolar-type H+-ATPase subunit E/Vma4
MGDRLAESIRADADAKELEGIAKDTAARASARTDTLVRDADSLFRKTLADLDRQIEALAETPLARDLEAQAKLDASTSRLQRQPGRKLVATPRAPRRPRRG